MSDPFGGAISQLLREASGSIPYNLPEESIFLESVKGLRSALIAIDPSTINHDLLFNFDQDEHYLQSAIEISTSQVTSGSFVSARLSGVYSDITGLGTQSQTLNMGTNSISNIGVSDFGDSGFGGPSFDAYSDGVKIVLRDNISATRVGVALGVTIEGDLWRGAEWFGNEIK